MNQNVSLRDAVDALREVSGHSHNADATRQRVLGTVRQRKRARRQFVTVAAVVLLGLPFGATAYAAFFGTPAFVERWIEQLAPRAETAAVAARRTSPVKETPRAPAVVAPAVVARVADPGVTEPVAAVSVPEPRAAEAPHRPRAEAVAPTTITPTTITPTTITPTTITPTKATTAPPPVVDTEALYARAHQLHFVTRDPQAALDAWNEYLTHAPAAALLPEAHYNRALCLVRLRRTQEALDTLAPFAEGAHGNYRRREAQALTQALTAAH